MIIQSNKPIELNFDYGELLRDADFVEKCENMSDQLVSTQKVLDKLLLLRANYEELPLDHKIELDLLLLFMLNSLYWLDLRLQGIAEPNHPIKREFDRIKVAMQRWQELKERDKRPTVNVDAAKRFVRSGLYDHTQNRSDGPPNKKIKIE